MPPTEPASPPATPGAPRPGSTRALPLVLLAVAGVLLVARIGFGIFERDDRAPRPDLVEWRVPGDSARAEARAMGKPILYDFMAEWCGPCHTMQDEVFADPRLAARINTMFVPVRVVDRQQEDGRNIPEVDALQRMYRIESFPTLVVASPDGAKHDSQQGYAGAGGTAQWLATAPLKVMKTNP